ncbi:ketosamine-3-kinase-like isoform X2 [Planococcus citri]
MDDTTISKIKAALGSKTLEATGRKASGCINQGEAFRTDRGLVFIKSSNAPVAKVLFESEFSSLKAIEQTGTIRVPHPITIVEGSDNTFYCVLEFLDLRNTAIHQKELGEKLADMHLHNEKVAKKGGPVAYVKQFGFAHTTCVGLLPLDNTWHDDWPTFYSKRLQTPIDLIVKEKGNTEVLTLWNELRPIIPRFFENITIKPSLLHGDLWRGNFGELESGPVIFDPGCLYGHHELELSQTTLFGGFTRSFYDAYHERIPKVIGYQAREQLYQLFHLLNHWHHFGGGYKDQSLNTMRTLIKTKFPLEKSL